MFRPTRLEKKAYSGNKERKQSDSERPIYQEDLCPQSICTKREIQNSWGKKQQNRKGKQMDSKLYLNILTASL